MRVCMGVCVCGVWHCLCVCVIVCMCTRAYVRACMRAYVRIVIYYYYLDHV